MPAERAGSQDESALAEVPLPITETARINHEALFPNHPSTLTRTDPELIEIFDNFAFDDVLRHGAIDTRTRLMVILASLIAQQALAEYRVMLAGALNVGVTPIEAKEILYHSVPYVGIAKAFDFLHATNEVLTSRGGELPLPGQSTTSPENRFEKGLALRKAIFGDRIDRMYEQAPEGQIQIQTFLSANCFGDYQTRSGLELKTRELLTFAILLSLGGCEPQLKGHIQGNANVGNDKAFLLAVVTQLLPFIGYPTAGPPGARRSPGGSGRPAQQEHWGLHFGKSWYAVVNRGACLRREAKVGN